MNYQKKIQKLIESLGFTKNKDFAEAIGASSARISNYINGRSVPDFEFFEMLKKAFPEVDIDTIFTDDDFVFAGEKQNKSILSISNNDTNGILEFLKQQLREKDKQIQQLLNNQSKPTLQGGL